MSNERKPERTIALSAAAAAAAAAAVGNIYEWQGKNAWEKIQPHSHMHRNSRNVYNYSDEVKAKTRFTGWTNYNSRAKTKMRVEKSQEQRRQTTCKNNYCESDEWEQRREKQWSCWRNEQEHPLNWHYRHCSLFICLFIYSFVLYFNGVWMNVKLPFHLPTSLLATTKTTATILLP